ncbi:TlpA family protein disulfide reductase [Lysobacter xanthus]
MSTRAILAAAAIAGVLGVAASLLLGGGMHGTKLARAIAPPPATAPGLAVAGVGDPIPALALPDLHGRVRPLADVLAGRPAILNFWASWCGPCLEEMPALDAFARRQGANGVQVVGIALDDADAVRAFLRRRPVGYAVRIDAPGPADAGARLGNARGVLPYSVLVGADGRILRRHAGPLTARDLDDWALDAVRTRD